MSFNDQVVIQILFIIARFFCTNEDIKSEIKNLQIHIKVHGGSK